MEQKSRNEAENVSDGTADLVKVSVPVKFVVPKTKQTSAPTSQRRLRRVLAVVH